MIQGRVGSFILLVLLTGVMLYARKSFQKNERMHIRRIAGLDAIDEMIGRVTEMGRPLAFVLGGAELEAQGFASMRILDHVAGEVAKYDARIFVVVPLPEMEPMCQEILKAAYMKEGKPESYNPSNVMYMPGDASKAGVLGLYQRERVAGAMLFGNYYYESMLFAEAANLAGASQIGGTANYHQLPFFVASCDYTLIGEEIFAAGTYLSKEPSEVGALTAQEIGKALSVALIIIGCILATFGNNTLSNLLQK
ncbi:MAG TPA: hypothetical protein GXX30_10920 [Firmicutes bacterium]|nr:hypothetical protein [Candidatus Fermentithermobacillaceae bacterium]